MALEKPPYGVNDTGEVIEDFMWCVLYVNARNETRVDDHIDNNAQV